ncbi:hypothetical protein T492DRAFT_849876 [Pavlovales sp. CCMP2436]|nr:hypothetical protein T492DRAFT_849876 [Pavlovales sp. CCMP2436]
MSSSYFVSARERGRATESYRLHQFCSGGAFRAGSEVWHIGCGGALVRVGGAVPHRWAFPQSDSLSDGISTQLMHVVFESKISADNPALFVDIYVQHEKILIAQNGLLTYESYES